VRRAFAELEALVAAKATPGPGLIACGRLGERSAFAAIETARGRLYHALSCDNMDRILIYGMVAPTEWNFHADGPLVRQLRGARLGRVETARDVADKLALLLDPCCAFETVVREM
jgi:coenzyme F420-reducing hydrogenase alpha subunit